MTRSAAAESNQNLNLHSKLLMRSDQELLSEETEDVIEIYHCI